jgi:L-iditol 2-dehydrogenase
MGGYADHVVVAANRVFPLPPGVPLDEAAFVEPLACLIAAVENGPIAPGSSALITGAGPMGLMLMQLVRKAGARVLVSEPAPVRREMALHLGAERAIDPTQESLADAVGELTGGRGVQTAFETAGHPAPLAQCVESLAAGGTAVVVGVAPATARLDMPLYPFHRKNLTLRGSYGGGDFAGAAKLLGTLDLQPIVSHRFGLAATAEAFDVARSGRGLKVLVETGR